MSGDGIIGYWSRKTVNSPFHCCNDDYESSEKEIIEVSLGEESCERGYF